MDPLSDVLSLLKPRSCVSAGFDAAGEWSIRFSEQPGLIKCYAVVSGACWLSVESVPDPTRLEAGDCFVLMLRWLIARTTMKCIRILLWSGLRESFRKYILSRCMTRGTLA